MKRQRWRVSVGAHPVVHAEERDDRGGVVYLRWYNGRGWARSSTGLTVRGKNGKVRRDLAAQAQLRALEHYEKLRAIAHQLEQREAKRHAPLAIGETWAVVSNPDTGCYPVDTPHRREVHRALQYASLIWGHETLWATIRKADLRKLWRRRIEALARRGAVGHRGAQITIQRVIAVAAWLRDEERIPETACIAPRHWKRELLEDWTQLRRERKAPEVSKPRYTLEEFRRLLRSAEQVDPRAALLFDVGAGLRLGQVAGAWRSDVELVEVDGSEAVALQIHGRGRKQGEILLLTQGQQQALGAALRGYLAPFEARYLAGELEDFRLFPATRLRRGQVTDRHLETGSVTRTAWRKWLREAERLAGVERMAGRGGTALRRLFVDQAKQRHISRDGLRRLGGWSDHRMADQVYADAEATFDRIEAREVRAAIRGE